MPLHFIVNLEPKVGCEAEFRNELLQVVAPTRAEPGCLSIHVFESVREPLRYAIHSEWVDEAAFELHATLPHTARFLSAARPLLTHRIEGLRSVMIA